MYGLDHSSGARNERKFSGKGKISSGGASDAASWKSGFVSILHLSSIYKFQAKKKMTSKLPSWETTKTQSKKGFDKAWGWLGKLGAPVNRLSNRIGSEAFWPTTLDKESDKAARILRSFCSMTAFIYPSIL
jgi:hypothetical protein